MGGGSTSTSGASSSSHAEPDDSRSATLSKDYCLVSVRLLSFYLGGGQISYILGCNWPNAEWTKIWHKISEKLVFLNFVIGNYSKSTILAHFEDLKLGLFSKYNSFLGLCWFFSQNSCFLGPPKVKNQ